jgi:hypothetical protein
MLAQAGCTVTERARRAAACAVVEDADHARDAVGLIAESAAPVFVAIAGALDHRRVDLVGRNELGRQVAIAGEAGPPRDAR